MRANKTKKFNKRMLFQVSMSAIASLFISLLVLIVFILLTILVWDWEIKMPVDSTHPRPSWLRAPFAILSLVTLSSFILGAFISIYLAKRFLKPVNELKKMTDRVAKGDFDVQINEVYDDEMGELTTNFNTMVKELRKNEVLKTDFVTNVSHEIKTPLATIQGYATLLQDESLCKEEKDKYTSIIIESTDRLSTLVNNILNISKIDNHKISIDKVDFNLAEQIREAVLSLESEWNNKNIELDINLEEININNDKNLLYNVWINLIGNAIKFSNDGGKVCIFLTKEGNKAIVKIKDYGCGISDEDLPYIFDKFYQADKSHSVKGNGLGLALVKKILTLVSGTVHAHSAETGSEFVVTLEI